MRSLDPRRLRATATRDETRALLALLVSAALATVVVLGRGGGWGGRSPEPSSDEQGGRGTTVTEALASPSAGAARLVVHVAGAVANPGVLDLPPGARVADAVEAAGGAVADADLSALNLARTVEDGERILVPAVGVGAGGSPAASVPAGRTADGRIDVNTADAATLEDLPGVGPVLAERIVAHREASGRFTALEDLLEVSGIGPAVLSGLREAAAAS